MRGLILLGVASLYYFLNWFITPDHIGYLPLYLLLAIAIGFKLLKVVHEWYHYVGLSTPVRPVRKREYTVDMLTTYVAGEPYKMVIDTLRAMVAVKYPHTTYLCDEADDPYLKQICEELGVVHVYRGKDKTDAKAGNINYALRTHAKGEITVILDPDHRPVPDFLDRVLPYFNDPKIGYVQCVQAYKNRNESFIAKGAAQQTYHFYGPMMMSMNTYGTVQAIGANCTFRRQALDEIGGHSAGLSEDMHTSMQLHARHWKSIYIPEALTRGLVPATLSGYYQQQLKWSRGTFELLFRIFPKLAFKFSIRQFLHYLTLPLYFLAGLITFIDLLVPIAALLMAQAPWRVDINELLQHSLPLLTCVTLIRQFAQKWLLEEHERGFHLLGGSLLMGTWWVFLVGLIYTIFRIKVPYIPTPKDDELTNEWRISVPNIVAIVLSIVAILIGFQLDWSPYTLIMAGFAGINVLMLGFVVLISQQKLLGRLYRAMYGGGLNKVRRGWYVFRHRAVYPVLRNTYVAFVAVVGVAAFSITSIKPAPKIDLAKWTAPAAMVPRIMLTDYDLESAPSAAGITTHLWQDTELYAKDLKIVSFDFPIEIDTLSRGSLPFSALQATYDKGQIPLVHYRLTPPAGGLWKEWDLQQLQKGRYDPALHQMGQDLAHSQATVYVHLDLDGDTESVSHSDMRNAWKYVQDRIAEVGISNLVWLWGGETPAEFPGQDVVDMVWIPWEEHPESGQVPLLDTLLEHVPDAWGRLPLLVDRQSGTIELSQTDRFALVQEAQIRPQLAGILTQGRNIPLKQQAVVSRLPLESSQPSASTNILAVRQTHTPAAPPEHWTLPPERIRGMVYNPSHDWRDGYHPLTRKKLLKDFGSMKELGVNTVRRYFPSIYDRNLFQVAEETGMHIWYGFWLDPKIDYAQDTAAVREQERQILEHLSKLRKEASIVAWNMGQETWAHLETYFPGIYLPQVRMAYLESLERMAHAIHQLDPGRPVSISVRDQDQLAPVLRAHRQAAPSVDILGINSFYLEHQQRLDSLVLATVPDRPYLMTEFGAGGYWDYNKTARNGDSLWIEPSDFAKAKHLREVWEAHIVAAKGKPLGGFAYCWQDRMEGTATWYGITDEFDQKKAAYYALKKIWSGGEVIFALEDAYMVPPLEIPGFRPYLPFWAVSEANKLNWVDYEWWVLRHDDMQGGGTVRVKKNPLRGDVLLPLTPGAYRIYVRISDDFGHAVTASHGFLVKPEMVVKPDILP